MTLANYLATPQAREDIRALVSGMADHCVFAEDLSLVIGAASPGGFLHIAVLDGQSNEPVIRAYYRPDGDRFVVTDLGDGVRALRLRTGCMDAIETWLHAFAPILRTDGVIEYRVSRRHLNALPDAICRVMLASLKIAGVSDV